VIRQSAAATHFEAVAADYRTRRTTGLTGRLRRQETRAVRALATFAPGDLVLDAGCGDGATLDWLVAAGARAVGIDVALGMARACRTRGHRVAVSDLARPALRRRFDWVLCIGVLEFTADPAAAIAALAALLRPGGRLVLLYPRITPLGALYALYHCRHGVAIRLFSRADVAALLTAAGLTGPEQVRWGWLSSACVAARPDVGR
jgi:2-polyprenyl-3-methyl-5-hydroxy-6-metoxy-1,4-benzoquinol methylase